MSVYGYVCCEDCKVYLWLGKAINWPDDARGAKSFVIGEGLNWKSETLNRVLWKMLAEHTGHTIKVVLDHEFEKLLLKDNLQEIGGDSQGDISFEDYLREPEG